MVFNVSAVRARSKRFFFISGRGMRDDKFITRINTSFYIINSRAIHHLTCFHHVISYTQNSVNATTMRCWRAYAIHPRFNFKAIVFALFCLWVKYVFRFECYPPPLFHRICNKTKQKKKHTHTYLTNKMLAIYISMLSVTNWTDEKRTEKSKPSVSIICSTRVWSMFSSRVKW